MSKTSILLNTQLIGSKVKDNISFYKEALVDFLFGFILSNSTVFSSCVPFGLSFYAIAFSHSSWIVKLTSVFLGVLCGAGIIGSLKYIFPLLVYTFSAVFIKFEHTYVKSGTMSLLLLLSSLVFAALNGFLLYDVVLAITEAFICFVGGYIIKNALPILKEGAKRSAILPEELISVTAMYAIFILSLSGLPEIFGVSPVNVLSIALILVMCYKGELGMGAAIGVTVGIINGINNYNLTSVIGAYAVSSLVAGIFKPYGKVGVSLGFVIANSVAAIFLNSSTEVLISIYDIIAAIIIFFVLPDKVSNYFTSFGKKTITSDMIKMNEQTKQVIRKRINGAALSLKELSKMYSFKNNLNYTKNEILNMFNTAAEKSCVACPTRFVCWQNDYKSTYKEMFEMLDISNQKGNITERDMPQSFKNKCTNTQQFALAFNNMTENLKADKIWKSKLFESRKNAAKQLSLVSDVIGEISNDILVGVDIEFENVIKAELDRRGVKFNYVWAVEKYGDENNFEITVSVDKNTDSTEKLVKEAVSEATNKDVRIGRIIKNDGETLIKVLPSEKFAIDVAISQACKEGEENCGDSFLSICLDGGGHILAISDGMGSGDSAHSESMSAIKLLEGFFEAGFELETSLDLINSSLLLKNTNDGFSTMDICSVDLKSGTLKFIKICSSQSYIKVGNEIEKIMFSSLPMGIVEKIDSPSCKRKIKNDCMVVMMSDGIADLENGNFIEYELRSLNSDNPKTVSEVILKKAIELSGGKPKDDMTVIAAKIWAR